MKEQRFHYLYAWIIRPEISAALVAAILHLYICFFMKSFVSSDAQYYLLPWFNILRKGGGLHALSDYPGDYNAPYLTLMALLTYLPFRSLYMIKFLSVLFDYILAAGIAAITQETTNDQRKSLTAFSMTLLLPTVLLNSGMWGQCDAIYSAFAIWSLTFLLKAQYRKAFSCFGLALAFKLQAIFILPVFIIVYFTRKPFSLCYFLIIPLMDILACLPAVFFGMPFHRVFTVYLEQGKSYSEDLVQLFPNVYQFLYNIPSDFFPIIRIIGVAITLAFFLLLLLYCVHKAETVGSEKNHLILLALISVIACANLLPNMHERYAYMGEVLCIAYYLTDHSSFLPAAIITGIPLITYYCYLMGRVLTDYPAALCGMAALNLTALIIMTRIFIRRTEQSDSPQKKISGFIS